MLTVGAQLVRRARARRSLAPRARPARRPGRCIRRCRAEPRLRSSSRSRRPRPSGSRSAPRSGVREWRTWRRPSRSSASARPGSRRRERQVAGVFELDARDESGRPLVVKVYGRNAYDNQLLATFWRTLWYQDGGPAPGLSRVQAVEHEALVTLLATEAGVPTRKVVKAGATLGGDALLVLRGAVEPLSELPDPDRRRARTLLARARGSSRRRYRASGDLAVDRRSRRRRAGAGRLRPGDRHSDARPAAERFAPSCWRRRRQSSASERAIEAAVDALGAERCRRAAPVPPAADVLRPAAKRAEGGRDRHRRAAKRDGGRGRRAGAGARQAPARDLGLGRSRSPCSCWRSGP